MSAQTDVIRISTIAIKSRIPSKYIVRIMDIVEPHKKHSASSRIPSGIDQRIFMQTVVNRAKSLYLSDKARRM